MDKKSRESSKLLTKIYAFDSILSDMIAHSCKELEERTGYSESTVKRTICEMRDVFDFPIESSREGYYYAEKTYGIPRTLFTEDQMVSYGFLKQTLSQFHGTPIWSPLQDLLETVAEPLENNTETYGNGEVNVKFKEKELPIDVWFEDRVCIAKRPECQVDDDVWDSVVLAMRKNRKIKIIYEKPSSNKPVERIVQPWQIVYDNQYWYLYGFCELRGSRRTFNFSCIKSAEVLGETFQLPKDGSYKLDKYTIGAFGISVGSETKEYKIIFKGDAKGYATRQWAESCFVEPYVGPLADSDALLLTFKSNQHYAIVQWVLSFGADVIPVAPSELVDEWKDCVRKMSKLADKI